MLQVKGEEKLMKDEDPPKKNSDPNQIKIVTKHVTKTSKNILKYSQCSKKTQAFKEDIEDIDVESDVKLVEELD